MLLDDLRAKIGKGRDRRMERREVVNKLKDLKASDDLSIAWLLYHPSFWSLSVLVPKLFTTSCNGRARTVQATAARVGAAIVFPCVLGCLFRSSLGCSLPAKNRRANALQWRIADRASSSASV